MTASVISLPTRPGAFLSYDRVRSLTAATDELDQVIDEVLAERDETLERMAYIEFGDEDETDPGAPVAPVADGLWRVVPALRRPWEVVKRS